MRPKLRGDTKYVPTPDGVYLQNNRRVLQIPGKQVYQWVDRLAPHLDGSRSLAELTAGLSADRAHMVERLVEMLTGAGFIKDVEDDRSHTLSAAQTDAYAAEIAFVDYYCDSAAARFETFRNTRVVTIGSGQTLTAAVAANLAVGLRTVEVLITDECPTDLDRLHHHLDKALERDPEQTLTLRTVAGRDLDEQALRTALEPFDTVLHLSDRPMLGRARMLDGICRTAGTLLLQAAIVGDQAWIGPPAGRDDESSGGWESAWRRLQATRTGSPAVRAGFAFTDDPRAQISEYLAAPTAAMVANHACFEVFKRLTGVTGAEAPGQLLRMDLETLRSTVHAGAPHPTCVPDEQVASPSRHALAQTVDRLARAEPVDEQVFSQQVRKCFDGELGLFTSIDEGELHQLPMNLCRVTVSNPALLSEPDEPVTAVGVGTDSGQARRRAAQRACELYAAGVVDERRLVRADGHAPQVWGYDLAEHRPRKVAAGSVFPVLGGLAPSLGTAPWLASGFSWAEAVTTALASACRQLTVAELELYGEPFPPVDLDVGMLDGQGARYLEILRAWAVPVRVYDVTGSLKIPTFAFCVDGADPRTVAYRSDVTVQDALRRGLEDLVTHEQARVNDQPAYAPPAVAELPVELRGARAIRPPSSSPGEWVHQQHQLGDALTRLGHRAVVVPLDHDPAVTDVLPHIVNMVLETR